MPLVSNFAIFKIPLWIAVMGLLIFGKYRERLFVCMAVLVLVVGDGGITSNIKRATNRPRPYQALQHVRKVSLYQIEIQATPEHHGRGRSMPSAHVANNVAVVWLLTWLYRPWGKLAWIWPALMAYSRVYTGDHYPSDVVIAFLVASIYTYAIAFIARRGWQRWAPSICPKLYEKHSFLFPSADSS